MPENFFANTKKEAIFNIFLGKRNFWDTFVTQKNGKIHVWGLISLKNSSIGPCRADFGMMAVPGYVSPSIHTPLEGVSGSGKFSRLMTLIQLFYNISGI